MQPDAAPGLIAGLRQRGLSRSLLALILGQLCLHSAMAGLRVAAPLQVLREGHGAWAVGLILSLFAVAPVLLALQAGRLADRYGYHRPLKLAVIVSITGGALAIGSTLTSGWLHFSLLCLAACAMGGGTNIGLIAIQRTAGRTAKDGVARMRVFSWLGLAPAMANMVGAVSVGLLIDASGFRAAYVFLCVLPVLSWSVASLVPREAMAAPSKDAAKAPSSAWTLFRQPGFARLLAVNWVISTCWDVHTFAVPILGHERGFSASVIGLILGVFPMAVTGVRLLIPLLAHRMDAVRVLGLSMLTTGVVFAIYPLLHSALAMGACAAVLGLALGAVQPMVLSTLHHLTPSHRHGEAIALRSMTINASSAVMPLGFGLAGTALGAGALFWVMGACVTGGAWVAQGLRRVWGQAAQL